MNTHTKRRGIFASVGALLTAAALALTGAGLATAAPTATIDSSKTANLHITKLTTPSGSPVASDGTQNNALPSGATGISGVEFTVKQITSVTVNSDSHTIDLKTNAGWAEAQKLTYSYVDGVETWQYDGATAAPTFATATTGITNTSGVATTDGGDTSAEAFTGLSLGLYYVAETSTPTGVIASSPFIVSLPITDPDDTTKWLYDVYAYPKNSVQTFTKTVDDSAAYIPDGTNNIVWTISADVPRVADTATTWVRPTAFTITDTLDTQLATISDSAVTVAIKHENGTDLGAQPVKDTDYTLNTTGNVVTVTFTGADAGFAKLQTAAATEGARVVVTITTQAKTPGTGTIADTNSGVITNGGAEGTNTATKLVTTVNGETDTQYTEAATSKWQNIVFDKIGQSGASDYLTGAVFTLYKTKADASGETNALVTSEASTAAADNVKLNNVRASDWENGATVDVTGYRVYWLVETTAPADHELLAEPVPVVILADGTLKQVTNADGTISSADDLADLTSIVNVEKNAGFALPLTGGTGTLVLTIGGIAILAVVLLVARRRRNSEAAAE